MAVEERWVAKRHELSLANMVVTIVKDDEFCIWDVAFDVFELTVHS